MMPSAKVPRAGPEEGTGTRDLIRVGIVIGQLHRGGAERQIYELATRLLGGSCEPFVYCLSPVVEPFGPMLVAAGVPLRVLPRRRSLEPRRVFHLARLFSQDRLDLVHSLANSPNLYSCLALLRAGRRPFLASNWAVDPTVSRFTALVNRMVYRRCDRVVVNSRTGAAFTTDFYRVPADKIDVVPNGLDVSRFASLADPGKIRPSLGIHANSPVVGFIGRFSPEKRPDLFLEVCRRVASRLPDARFLMVGDGPCLADARRLSGEIGLESKVVFTGFRDDTPDLLAAMDVLLLTSSQEGLPNAILEAMAAARPVVATDVGGCHELTVEGTTGYLVPYGNADALAERVILVLSAPDRGRALGEAGRRRVFSEFSADVMAGRFRDLYLHVHSETSSRRG